MFQPRIALDARQIEIRLAEIRQVASSPTEARRVQYNLTSDDRSTLQLGQFLSHRETNLRYLALESMCLLATSEFSHEAVKKHQETVINALKTERDVSVRQRAVDLLYAMCDRTNSEDIVLEMLTYLEVRTA